MGFAGIRSANWEFSDQGSQIGVRQISTISCEVSAICEGVQTESRINGSFLIRDLMLHMQSNTSSRFVFCG